MSDGKELTVAESVAMGTPRDPEKELEFGRRCANALMSVVAAKPKKVIINGEQYLEFEDWMTIGRFFNATVGTEWTRPLRDDTGAIIGFEARANVLNDGKMISAAESSCLRSEPRWKMRDEFQLRSMAQTRACAKALRNAFSWVAVLAGYKPTPAEEMDGVVETSAPVTYTASINDLASEAQLRTIGSLCKDKRVASTPGEAVAWAAGKFPALVGRTWDTITKKEASAIIKLLMELPMAV